MENAQVMTVRGRQYCEIESGVWQRCDAPHLASVAPGGGGLAVVLVLGAVGAVAVVDYRRRTIEAAIATLDEVM